MSETSPRHELVRQWWYEWIKQERNHSGKKNSADRANLRRAKEPWEIVMIPAFHDLVLQVRDSSAGVDDNIWVCWLAHILAWVEENDPRSMGEILAKAEVSESRFKRLLQSQTVGELATQMQRILQQSEHSASIKDLVNAFCDWSSPQNREKIRHTWAFAYYQHLPKNKENK